MDMYPKIRPSPRRRREPFLQLRLSARCQKLGIIYLSNLATWLVFKNKLPATKSCMDADNGLRYSAVLIAYNEEAHIMDAIQSLKAQSVPPYRIVVVDDGSTDGTPGLLAEAGVTVITLPKHDGNHLNTTGVGSVRAAGLAEIKDDPIDWIYSGDGDTVIPVQYCECLMKTANQNPRVVITGGTLPGSRDIRPPDNAHMIRRAWSDTVNYDPKASRWRLILLAFGSGHEVTVWYGSTYTIKHMRPIGTNYSTHVQFMRGANSRRWGLPLHLAILLLIRRMFKPGRSYPGSWMRGYLSARAESSQLRYFHAKLIQEHYKVKFLHSKNSCVVITPHNSAIRLQLPRTYTDRFLSRDVVYSSDLILDPHKNYSSM